MTIELRGDPREHRGHRDPLDTETRTRALSWRRRRRFGAQRAASSAPQRGARRSPLCAASTTASRWFPLVEVLRCRSIAATNSRQPSVAPRPCDVRDVRSTAPAGPYPEGRGLSASQDFEPFLFGFRPGWSAHDALAVLRDGRKRPKREAVIITATFQRMAPCSRS